MKFACLLTLIIPFLSIHANSLEEMYTPFQLKQKFEYTGFYTALEKRYYAQAKLDVTLKEAELAINPIHGALTEQADTRYEQEGDYALIWKVFGGTLLILFILISRYREVKQYNTNLRDLNKKLEKLSTTDALTDIYNRRYLDEALRKEYERAKRYETSFSIILIDIDDFKSINDTFGHDKGDDVLQIVTSVLLSTSRVNDIVGRWGGEEFMVVCPNTTQEGALQVAEKMRHAIEQQALDIDKRVTASFGILEHDPEKSYHWHISAVDKALYQAKREGKNRVCSLCSSS